MLRGFDCITLHIVKVFFRKSLNENVLVFNAKGRYGTTLTSCRFMRIGAFYGSGGKPCVLSIDFL